ncbi:hypothetical protein [Methylobacterium dankookense]|uniref:Uncharacterized protein n=1 Tax=Methylobacterium dankookense TaxID=560405 RepID=A0A564FV51_9HYPH|nr:hypothetical protein [Methylobacterium dankookense]GJD59358.1 hypothetical protein IFDJLNFL_5286 [Methylobacterium dankookense]VUF11626.1 hypothetical protein MTDSW087_01310 [Methylobacterium dankookense]
MRILLAPALLLAACGSAPAAEPTPFRAALAAAGGCGQHRVLAEERLGGLGTATASAVPQGEADLFGKPAGQWTEDEIRDALAAFAACESRSGPAATGRERLARDLRSLEAALRRAIVVGHALAPAETGEERPPHGSGRGAAQNAAPAPSGSGRLRQGPAFIPAARTAGASPESRPPAASLPDAGPAEARLEAAAAQAVTPVPEEAAPAIRTGGAREQGHAAPEAPGRPAPVAAHRPPPERMQCPISLGTFEMLQAEMRLAEVEALIGCRGSVEGTATIPGLGAFETYLWSDRGGSATVTLVFQNKRLKSKVQRGLAAEAARGS